MRSESMRRIRFHLLATLTISFLPLTHLWAASETQPYIGQYVLRLGTRNYFVLNLHQLGNLLTGTLSHPRYSSLGTFISDIGPEVVTEPVTSTIVNGDHLHFVVTNPSDAKEKDEYDLKLLSATQASLAMTGLDTDPWTLNRVPESPTLAVSSDWESGKAYYVDDISKSNPVMQRIFDEDQKPRQPANITHADWAAINKQDEDRRAQVRDILSKNELHSGKDFELAALIFQHGLTPEDYLLAHTLAMIAVAHGNAGALWIATATLDRYLKAIKQPQIYGTQFSKSKDGAWTQELYNRTLISDELRRQLNVPSQAAQEKQLEAYKSADQH
jgi:hypothetical protein